MAKAKKLPSGNWNVKIFAGTDSEGKRRYESFTAPTKREAEFLAAEFAAKRKDRMHGGLTVGEAVSRYIDSKESVLSPATVREYRKSAKNHLQALHPVKLRDITQEAVQKAINQESKTHSPKTVRNMHGLLSAALAMFLPDFTLRTALPQKERQKVYIPTDEDVKKLLAYIEGSPLEVPVLLAATGSLRRSEISALTPDDVTDLGVTVNKALVQDPHNNWVVKQPKTTAGYRFCPLPPQVVEKVRAGVPTIMPNAITRRFERALDACGLPHFTFHKLRHYYASVLHSLGVPDKYIMLNGGWECQSVLHDVYQHAMQDRVEKENQKVVHFFGDLYDTAKQEDDIEYMQHEKQHESS